ncbi:NAD(P)/FAD-dependent oxidoreductase [Martelella soudanensis]|uniref:NAD(P)/FAD-dependent oxidoreductase n=1 Tax=unclassified Martelella TaxID=2629616 RepID=UPI0015DE6D5A|nr:MULTISPECIES: FAD-dependent oxidoreductase [unclassified Martelella]
MKRREFLSLGALGAAATTFPMGMGHAETKPVATKANIVIVGAGAAGTTMANRLNQRLEGARITIIDPRTTHLYQPGLSLVATGLKPADYITSDEERWLPEGVNWIREPVAAIDAESRIVATESGAAISYDWLVLAPGLVLDYDAIDGFSRDLIGSNGVGALYGGPDDAARTWQAARKFTEEGGTGIFTRPETEMKCAGAPLKHTFLIDDIGRRAGNAGRMNMIYAAPQASLFGVPIVAEKVRMLFEDRGVETMMQRRLVAIEPGAKRAVFAVDGGFEELDYDYIHVIPPQRAPDFIRRSGLSWAERWQDQGWVEVDPATLRHLRYPEIFALGDVAGVPKGKTAASVKWQAPVVEDHLVSAIAGLEATQFYDGYTSCPLITRVGRAMLVEFDYHNNLTPSFPGIIAPLEELWTSWLMKEIALKATYNAMLRGRA